MWNRPVYIHRAAASFVREGDGYRLEEPDYKQLIPNAVLRRRMSRIVRMGVATGLQCLHGAPPADAILTATGLGCLADTEKFMNDVWDHDEQQPSPTAFIQSTFNTIGAQIALLTGNHGYNLTYVHRAFSFESALLDAILSIQEKESSVILVGAVDEMTPTLHTILARFGCWKKEKPGEGAAFFLLSDEPADTGSPVLADMDLFSGEDSDRQTEIHIAGMLERNGLSDVRILYPALYKGYCGEYPTAMSFALWYACRKMQESDDPRPLLLCNHFLDNHSLILLKRNSLWERS